MDWNLFLEKFIEDFELAEKNGQTLKAFFPDKNTKRTYAKVSEILGENGIPMAKNTITYRVNAICNNKKMNLNLYGENYKLCALRCRLYEEYNKSCQDMLISGKISVSSHLIADTDELIRKFTTELKAAGIISLEREVRAVVEQHRNMGFSGDEILDKVLSMICPQSNGKFKSDTTNLESKNDLPTDDDFELAYQLTKKILDLRFK